MLFSGTIPFSGSLLGSAPPSLVHLTLTDYVALLLPSPHLIRAAALNTTQFLTVSTDDIRSSAHAGRATLTKIIDGRVLTVASGVSHASLAMSRRVMHGSVSHVVLRRSETRKASSRPGVPCLSSILLSTAYRTSSSVLVALYPLLPSGVPVPLSLRLLSSRHSFFLPLIPPPSYSHHSSSTPQLDVPSTRSFGQPTHSLGQPDTLSRPTHNALLPAHLRGGPRPSLVRKRQAWEAPPWLTSSARTNQLRGTSERPGPPSPRVCSHAL